MRAIIWVFAVTLAVGQTALAEDVQKTETQKKLTPRSLAAAKTLPAAHESGPSNSSLWFGVSTDVTILASSIPSISVGLGIGEKMFIQTYVNMTSTSPLLFGVGAAGKFVLLGDLHRGINVGGGLGLGIMPGGLTTATSFFWRLAGIAGVHFQVMEGVLLTADTGLTVISGMGSTDIQLGGHSGLLGGMSLLVRI